MASAKKNDSNLTLPLSGGCWPCADEILLLKAAVSRDPETAGAAWHAWYRFPDIHNMPEAYQRLLPLIFFNFKSLGIEKRLPPQLKHLHRRTWHQNQVLFHEASRIMRFFKDNGIAVLILKGLALAQSVYAHSGLRPMSDMDLLVRPGQAADAFGFLLKLGWTPNGNNLLRSNFFELINTRHAWGFRNPEGRELDLHWQTLEQISDETMDEDFWQQAVFISILGMPVLTLNPTDHLFHICLHGIKWNRMPPLRWVADAAMIMNHPDSHIEWDRLLYLAHRYRVALNIRMALSFLDEVFDLPVPPAIREQLERENISWSDQIFYFLNTQPPWPLGQFLLQWQSQYRKNRSFGLPRRFMRTLKAQHRLWRQRLWQTDSPGDFFTLERCTKSAHELLKMICPLRIKR